MTGLEKHDVRVFPLRRDAVGRGLANRRRMRLAVRVALVEEFQAITGDGQDLGREVVGVLAVLLSLPGLEFALGVDEVAFLRAAPPGIRPPRPLRAKRSSRRGEADLRTTAQLRRARRFDTMRGTAGRVNRERCWSRVWRRDHDSSRGILQMRKKLYRRENESEISERFADCRVRAGFELPR